MFFDKSIRYTQRQDYQICNNCVMDTSASEIYFDSEGICGFCAGVNYHIERTWFPTSAGSNLKREFFQEIRSIGKNKKHDCLIGLSGGVDSAMVLFQAIENGLRPLVLHIDTGWNTRESVSNVERLTKNFNLDLHTIVIDWDTMRDLQIAYLESGVLNQDVPQDHALFASIYKFAIANDVTTILSGVNYSSESVEPASWGYTYIDGKQIKYIARKFGRNRLRNYPIMRITEYKKLISRNNFEIFRPLDYGVYNPSESAKVLQKLFGWENYEHKHSESLFTNFFQSIYLYEKYGIDKRRNNYSSLILSGNMSRNEAIEKLSKSPTDKFGRNRLMQSVCSKLNINEEQMDKYLNGEKKDHYSYPNDSHKI
jgi:N-acetyl sugar amidotransferase